MEFLSVEQKNEIAYVTFENPKEYNTLTLRLLEELDQLLKEIAKKREVKVVVLQGNEKAFSAGHSLREIQKGDLQDVQHLFNTCMNVMKTFRAVPQLIVSKVRGVAVAAGTQVVAISDLAIASEDARFATPGINSGLFCSTPAVFLSRNIGRKKAAELLFTGNLMSAQEALEHGLVNKVVPADKLDEETDLWLEDITKQSLNIIELGKKQFYTQLQMTDFDALAYATEVISLNAKHPDAIEGINAFFEKRRPVWTDEKNKVDVT